MKVFASTIMMAGAASATEMSLMEMDHATRHEKMMSYANSMDKTEGLNKLSQLNSAKKAEVEAVLATKKLKKETATRAVETLNNMWLEEEAKLDEKMFACTAERHNRLAQIDLTQDELEQISLQYADSMKTQKEADDLKEQETNEKNRLEDEMEVLKGAYDEQKAKDDDDLEELDGTLAVMSFLLEIAQCKEAPKLMLAQESTKNSSMLMKCKKEDAENGSYMVNMFADPELRNKIANELTPPQQKRLNDLLGSIDAGEENDDDANMAFLQLAQDPSGDDEFKSCAGFTPDCALMTDKVGGMYGDAKDAVDEKEAEMEEKKKDYEKQYNHLKKGFDAAKTEVGFALQEIAAQAEEQTALNNAKDNAQTVKRDQMKEYRIFWDACKEAVNKIMFDGVCSVLNVRKNVLDTAAGVLGVKPDEISNCKVTEWAPSGDCSHQCVGCKAGERCVSRTFTAEQFTQEAKLHSQKWTRSHITIPKEGDRIALPCPSRMEAHSTCNEINCPIDCVQSEWSKPSTCSAKCDGGLQRKTRKVVTRNQYNGKPCDAASETIECGQEPCNQDCVLQLAKDVSFGPCVRACMDRGDKMFKKISKGNEAFRLGSRKVIKKQKGPEGKCPKKWNSKREVKAACKGNQNRRCRSDEVCIDQMDVVFAIDASGSLGENGFATFQNFTNELIGRLQPRYAESPAVRVAIVQFGNGGLMKQKVDDKTVTLVRPADVLTSKGRVFPKTPFYGGEKNTPTEGTFKDVAKIVDDAKWRKGFMNMGQGLVAACRLLKERGRAYSKTKKVVVISDGQPTLKFATTQAATECKDGQITLDFVVVNKNFDASNASFKIFQTLPSYPWQAHTHPYDMDSILASPTAIADKLIPRICPRAISMSLMIKKSAKKGVFLLHRGRDCGNWWVSLGRHKNAKSCATQATKKGYKSFVFQFSKMNKSRRRKYWCWTDKVQGKKEAIKNGNPMEPVDDTCACKNRYCTGKVKYKGKAGWREQRRLKFWGYSHWMVIPNIAKFKETAGKFAEDKLTPLTLAQAEVEETSKMSLQDAEAEMDAVIREVDAEDGEETTDEELAEGHKLLAARMAN